MNRELGNVNPVSMPLFLQGIIAVNSDTQQLCSLAFVYRRNPNRDAKYNATTFSVGILRKGMRIYVAKKVTLLP